MTFNCMYCNTKRKRNKNTNILIKINKEQTKIIFIKPVVVAFIFGINSTMCLGCVQIAIKRASQLHYN